MQWARLAKYNALHGPRIRRSGEADSEGPVRQVAGRKLWLGHAGDLRDPRAVLAAGIEAVVELADSEQLAEIPRELVRCRFPLSDGGVNPPWLLRLAAESVAALLRAGAPTLVCCASGLSRSLCIAAAGVAVAEGRPLDRALSAVVGSGPADVSPGLLAQVRGALGYPSPDVARLAGGGGAANTESGRRVRP